MESISAIEVPHQMCKSVISSKNTSKDTAKLKSAISVGMSVDTGNFGQRLAPVPVETSKCCCRRLVK